MSDHDPFETYREQREIELLETRFKKNAEEKKQRHEEAAGPDEEAEQDLKVTQEMEEFLNVSTQNVEDALGTFNEESEAPAAEPPPPAAPPAPPAESEAPPPADEELMTPDEDRPEGKPMDLMGALERIRKSGHGDFVDAAAPPQATGTPAPPPPADQSVEPQAAPPLVEPHPAPPPVAPKPVLPPLVPPHAAAAPAGEPAPPPVEALPPLEHRRIELPKEAPEEEEPEKGLLENFDATFDEMSGLLERQMTGQAVEKAAPAGTPSLQAAAPIVVETPPAAAPPVEEPVPEQTASGSTVFSDDPEDDVDIDDDLEDSEPPGWDIPARPPPPGAWVVEKQKEEGDAGLAGSAGDTYLLRKLCQEVRGLNCVYLALLDKDVVTREEVEGPGAPGSGEGEGDDDEVSVDDFDGERYRPILVSEGDFSLSGLVNDVHRLKKLRDVLVKKGVVSAKEIEKKGG